MSKKKTRPFYVVLLRDGDCYGNTAIMNEKEAFKACIEAQECGYDVALVNVTGIFKECERKDRMILNPYVWYMKGDEDYVQAFEHYPDSRPENFQKDCEPQQSN